MGPGFFIAIAALGLSGYALFTRKKRNEAPEQLTYEEELADLTVENPEYATMVQQAVNAPASMQPTQLDILATNLDAMGYRVLAMTVANRRVETYGV